MKRANLAQTIKADSESRHMCVNSFFFNCSWHCAGAQVFETCFIICFYLYREMLITGHKQRTERKDHQALKTYFGGTASRLVFGIPVDSARGLDLISRVSLLLYFHHFLSL